MERTEECKRLDLTQRNGLASCRALMGASACPRASLFWDTARKNPELKDSCLLYSRTEAYRNPARAGWRLMEAGFDERSGLTQPRPAGAGA